MLKRWLDYLTQDIWRIRIRKLPRPKYFLFRILRIFILALRGFNEDKCQLRASALTFYTLLSVVPIAAMAFGVAKGFGFDKNLQNLIMEKMPGQEEVAKWIIQFSHSFLSNAKGGLIAGIGIIILFWTVIKVLGNIETSFNDIWGIKQGRSLGRRFSEYLSLIVICPFLMMVSSSMTVFITSQLTRMTEKVALLGSFSPLIFSSLKLIPYIVVWTVFTFIYMFIPNTKVSLKAGLLAGVISGTIYQFIQWVYIFFQIGVSRHNAIYGSFAALPLFLIWLQTSWLVVLLGAEISFAVDNEETYEFEHDSLNASLRFKRLLALKIVEMCAKNFVSGEKPLNVETILHHLEAPIRLVREIIFDLVNAHILSEIKDEASGTESYQPAQDLEKLTLKRVLDLLDKHGRDEVLIVNSAELEKIAEKMETLDHLLETSSENIPLKSL